MRFVHTWIFTGLMALLVAGCTTTPNETSQAITPSITVVPSIIPTQTQVRASAPATNTAVMATVAPTAVAVVDQPATADQMAFMTADGYHAFGDPAAPVVMFDYSDFF